MPLVFTDHDNRGLLVFHPTTCTCWLSSWYHISKHWKVSSSTK
jgi:hypothetical protein